LTADARFCALSVCDRQVLLLFRQGASSTPSQTPGGVIPGHDATGSSHLAFSIAASELQDWERRLADEKIRIEGKVSWPRGGFSVYFRDPDGHLLELVTPGTWSIY